MTVSSRVMSEVYRLALNCGFEVYIGRKKHALRKGVWFGRERERARFGSITVTHEQ